MCMLRTAQILDSSFNRAITLNKTTSSLIKRNFVSPISKLLSLWSKKCYEMNSKAIHIKMHHGGKITLCLVKFLWKPHCAPLAKLCSTNPNMLRREYIFKC